MLKQIKFIFLTMTGLFALGCGGGFTTSSPVEIPRLEKAEVNDFQVKSRIMIDVATDTKVLSLGNSTLAGNPALVPISVVNKPQVSMIVDTSNLVIPTIKNALLDFGTIKITELTDNNLHVCESKDNKHCGTAAIRIYTTGSSGAGLYNTTDGYGVPITAGLVGSTLLNVGLESAHATIVQTAVLQKKNALQLADFSPSPEYSIKVDFSGAGAGTFSTTLVIEYGLLP